MFVTHMCNICNRPTIESIKLPTLPTFGKSFVFHLQIPSYIGIKVFSRWMDSMSKYPFGLFVDIFTVVCFDMMIFNQMHLPNWLEIN